MTGEHTPQPAEDAPPPPPGGFCPTCLGARKVVRFFLVKGRTSQAWLSCPRCNRPSRIVPGP